MKAIVAFILLFSVVKADIYIKLTNMTDKIIQLKITAGEQTAPTEAFIEYYAQTIQPNATMAEYVKVKDVKRGMKIIVTGAISGMGTFKFDERTIFQKSQKIDVSLHLTAVSVPDDNTSYQDLISQLNYTPPKGSEMILAADIAYKTYFGALSVRKNGVEIDRIEPTVLKAEMSPIQFGPLSRSIEVFFSGNFLTENKGNAPGIASVNLSVNRDELYKLKYNLSDVGMQVWTGPNGKSISNLINEMDELNRNNLVRRYLADTTLQIMQYDKLYLFKTMNISMEKYKRTNVVIDANVPVFYSGGLAYKKEDSETFTTGAYSTVLNVWATKNVTQYVVQAAQDFLEKQKRLVIQASTTKDALGIVAASELLNKDNVVALNEKMTKADLEKGLNEGIKELKEKESKLNLKESQ